MSAHAADQTRDSLDSGASCGAKRNRGYVFKATLRCQKLSSERVEEGGAQRMGRRDATQARVVTSIFRNAGLATAMLAAAPSSATPWQRETLHAFANPMEGLLPTLPANPSAILIRAADGAWYGATDGTVFRLDAVGSPRTLHTFGTPPMFMSMLEGVTNLDGDLDSTLHSLSQFPEQLQSKTRNFHELL